MSLFDLIQLFWGLQSLVQHCEVHWQPLTLCLAAFHRLACPLFLQVVLHAWTWILWYFFPEALAPQSLSAKPRFYQTRQKFWHLAWAAAFSFFCTHQKASCSAERSGAGRGNALIAPGTVYFERTCCFVGLLNSLPGLGWKLELPSSLEQGFDPYCPCVKVEQHPMIQKNSYQPFFQRALSVLRPCSHVSLHCRARGALVRLQAFSTR